MFVYSRSYRRLLRSFRCLCLLFALANCFIFDTHRYTHHSRCQQNKEQNSCSTNLTANKKKNDHDGDDDDNSNNAAHSVDSNVFRVSVCLHYDAMYAYLICLTHLADFQATTTSLYARALVSMKNRIRRSSRPTEGEMNESEENIIRINKAN